MRRDDFVDFHLVRDEHLAIHADLENWGRWAEVRKQGWPVSPMFRQFRSNWRQWTVPVLRAEVNQLDALKMERAVRELPEKERFAIRWAYVFKNHPAAVARHLAVSRQGLAELIRVGRVMLSNTFPTKGS